MFSCIFLYPGNNFTIRKMYCRKTIPIFILYLTVKQKLLEKNILRRDIGLVFALIIHFVSRRPARSSGYFF